MKAIITVIGKDKVGIIAAVSGELQKMKVNIEDISQTTMQNYFTMIMMAETEEGAPEFEVISKRLRELGKQLNMEIEVRHEDIFNAMHRV